MKRCLSCAEIVSEEDDFCRNCGSSSLVPYEQQSKEGIEAGEQDQVDPQPPQMNRAIDSYRFSHFLVGLVVIAIVQIPAYVLGYQSGSLISSNSKSAVILDITFAILAAASLIICWIGVIGWKGKFSVLHYIGIILTSYIPIIGQLIISLFIGRGIFVLLERRKMQNEPSG